VDGYCTCGAKLPDDALFCHRCGRPLRELVPPQPEESETTAHEEATPVEPVAVPPAEPPVINFHNGTAVRVGFLAAALVQLVSTLSAAAGASLLMPLVLLGGGFYAVVLYIRRTGTGLSVLNGARMGWITGIFSFVIMTVFFTAGIAILAGSDQLLKAYKESAQSLGLPADAADQIQKVLADPGAFALSIGIGLAFQFLLLTALCSMGGALGARFSAGRRN